MHLHEVWFYAISICFSLTTNMFHGRMDVVFHIIVKRMVFTILSEGECHNILCINQS